MRKLLIAGVLAASAMAMPAQAQVSIQFAPGSNTVAPTQTLVNQFLGTGPNRTALVGTNAFTYFADTSGEARLDPVDGLGNNANNNGFGAVLEGGSYTFTIPALIGAAQVFSFLVGTLDSYNQVTLNFAGGAPLVLNGFAIAGLTGGSGDIGGRVTYDANGGPAITSVTFASSQRSFEFDDFAAAAPEPETWAMMILGFGLAGAALRRRRRTSTRTWAIA